MKSIKVRGAEWKYNDLNTEQSETILLVHGHPFDHSMWKYQYEALSAFRLILPDLKGYGQSATDFTKIHIEEQALDLALLLDELGIKQVHLIGLSMGGQIIVEFQRLFPQRVKSLVIAASTPTAETSESYTNRLKIAANIEQIGMLEYTKNDIHKYINLDQISKVSATYQHLFTMMSNTKVQGAVASHRGRAERRDNFAYLKQIEIPTLVIAAEKDYFFKVAEVQKIAEEIDDAQFGVIK
ncbi:MAG: alpha/beta fold hydrolase, partial [Saprospiraceae bacterium]